jgi:uncharacterized protein YndB with AHSA1/START domain
MLTENSGRVIRGEVVVDAGIDEVWDAWTTKDGIRSFFAPACNVDIRPDGPYEILFDLDAPPGDRGAEGMRVMSVQPKSMLAFTWSAPAHMPNIRLQRTHVVLRFREIDGAHTAVTLVNDGYGEGEEWDQALEYFSRAWNEVVLARLKYRFAVGPVDWSAPSTPP